MASHQVACWCDSQPALPATHAPLMDVGVSVPAGRITVAPHGEHQGATDVGNAVSCLLRHRQYYFDVIKSCKFSAEKPWCTTPTRRCDFWPSICQCSILLHQYLLDRVWCWVGRRIRSMTTAVVLIPGARAALGPLSVRSPRSPTARNHSFGDTFELFVCCHARFIGSTATRPDLYNHVPATCPIPDVRSSYHRDLPLF